MNTTVTNPSTYMRTNMFHWCTSVSEAYVKLKSRIQSWHKAIKPSITWCLSQDQITLTMDTLSMQYASQHLGYYLKNNAIKM